jgi:hypothetical protein
MNESDRLLNTILEDRRTLAAAAPEPNLPALWRRVREEREARLEARLARVAAAPPALLLLAGAAAALWGSGGLHVGLPCWAIAFWLASSGVVVAPPRAVRSALTA